MTATRTAGIDAKAARLATVTLLDAAFAREMPDAGPIQYPPDLQAYIRWRSTPVTSLIAALRSVVPEPTQLLLIDAEGTRATGIDLPAVVRIWMASCTGPTTPRRPPCPAFRRNPRPPRPYENPDRRVPAVPPRHPRPRRPFRPRRRLRPPHRRHQFLLPRPRPACPP